MFGTAAAAAGSGCVSLVVAAGAAGVWVGRRSVAVAVAGDTALDGPTDETGPADATDCFDIR